MAVATKQGRIFYGWWIVLAGSVVMALQGGIYFYGIGAFLKPLTEEFGGSRAAISGAVSLSRLESGILGPIAGFLVDRLGPRRMMLLGLSVMGIGYMLLSRVDSVVWFYIVFIFGLSAGSSFGTGVAVSAAIGNWFRRKRSRALGVMMCGVGLGGLAVPLLGWLIVNFGWRWAAIGAGLIIMAFGLPLALIMRHRPEPYGLLPDGASAEEAGSNTGTVRVPKIFSRLPKTMQRDEGEEVDFTARQAIGTKAFWILGMGFALHQMVTGAVALHEVAFLEDVGISTEVATGVLGLMTLISIPGRLFFGWLGDVMDKRWVVSICNVLKAVGILLLLNVQENVWQVIPFLLVYGPAYGGSAPLMGAIRGEYFGRKSFATIQGFMQMIMMWGSFAGPVFAGYIFDVTGAYRIAFITFAVSSLASVPFFLMARKPRLMVAQPVEEHTPVTTG